MPRLVLAGLGRRKPLRDLIRKTWNIADRQSRNSVADGVDDIRDPHHVGSGKIAENMARDAVSVAGMPDAKTDADIIAADVGIKASEAVVSGIAAALLAAYLPRVEIDLVVQNDDILRFEPVIAHGLRHGTTGLVHVGLGFERKGTFAG